MIFNSIISLTLVSIGFVCAQSTTGTGSAAVPSTTAGIDPCITNCSTQAALSSGCVSFTNFTCVCTSTVFQSEAGACLAANCTTADLTAAMALQSSVCAPFANSSSSASGGGAAPSGSGSGTSAPATGSPTSPATTGAPAASTPAGSTTPSPSPSTGAALGMQPLVGHQALYALGAAAVAAILGGVAVL